MSGNSYGTYPRPTRWGPIPAQTDGSGITATDVPRQLKHIVDALVYEGNRTDEE